jgi:NAD(P)-dependent dehydrogenase (short-subunit alcohol dehydrogenase family)
MGLLDNKTCLVTGAASNPGLGHSIAHVFAREGAEVLVTDIDGEGAQRTAEEILGAGGKAVAWQQDVSSEQAWDDAVERIRRDHGKLDAIVNNAGIAVLKPIEEITLDEYNRQMLINMTSVFLGTQRAVALMRENSTRGSIINMSSVAALVGVIGVTAYAASKGGVLGFTKAVAAETAREGIRCNTIHPGLIDTNMQKQAAVENTAEYEALNEAVPMGYMGKPQTIADAALFLASDLSSYVTGTQLVVDGGMINQ